MNPDPSIPTDNASRFRNTTTAVVITTAMLTFISAWRAAAVVLCDLASSAYYACGVAEQAIGKAAPWFVIAVMILSLLVRLVFMESCGMFVRGGVYKTVRAALGGPVAKLAISALLFDYILTGPVSAVSAAQYLGYFLEQAATRAGYSLHISSAVTVLISVIITCYFWRKNIIGMHESSTKALRIVQLTGVMVVMLLVWSIITLVLHPQPLPTLQPVLHEHALGWLKDFDFVRSIPAIAIAIALGHSLLAMSGEEALSQVYREIAAPKMRNLKRAAIIIFVASFLLTGVISLFAVMIIPDAVRGEYSDKLLSGLAEYLAGPETLRFAMHAFVVLVGVLLLSGAVSTSMIGGTGGINRLAEDHVLPQWLRVPHPRFGTTYRSIHIFSLLQVLICILSRGDVYLLGEAYAFGVVWSFVFQTFAVLVLRWRDHTPREFKVPLNLHIGRTEVPLGIAGVFVILLTIAVANFFTKTLATIFGGGFTILLFILLTISERWSRRGQTGDAHYERVNLAYQATVDPNELGLKHANRVLVAVRDPRNLTHLRRTLERINASTTDLIVIAIKMGELSPETHVEQLPLEEQSLITNVVSVAETFGVHVVPIIVPAADPIYAIAKAAYDLNAQEIVVGRSGKTRPDVQLEKLALAWGYVTADGHRPIRFRVIWPQQELRYDLN